MAKEVTKGAHSFSVVTLPGAAETNARITSQGVVQGYLRELLVDKSAALFVISPLTRPNDPLVVAALEGSAPRTVEAWGSNHVVWTACVCTDTGQVACGLQNAGGAIVLLDEHYSVSKRVTLDGSDVIAVGAVGATLLAISEAAVGIFALPEGNSRRSSPSSRVRHC